MSIDSSWGKTFVNSFGVYGTTHLPNKKYLKVKTDTNRKVAGVLKPCTSLKMLPTYSQKSIYIPR